jgi:deazaflavin-dependent oxidoreductase (nitroreductase family)
MTSTDGATLAPPSRSQELLRAISRATAPISRPLAGHRFLPLWAVLRHRGRRTGREYAVPVAIRATEEAFVIAIPFGERTQWVRNVVEAGGCTIRWQAAEHPATAPSIIGYEEAAPAFSPMQRWILRRAGVSRFVRLSRVSDGRP